MKQKPTLISLKNYTFGGAFAFAEKSEKLADNVAKYLEAKIPVEINVDGVSGYSSQVWNIFLAKIYSVIPEAEFDEWVKFSSSVKNFNPLHYAEDVKYFAKSYESSGEGSNNKRRRR